MNWANYLIQINLYLTLFYAFYMLFLRNETFFNLNRAYLLSAAFFSVSIPLIRTEWFKSIFFTETMQQNWSSVNVMVMEGFATPIKQESTWALGDYLTFVYLFVMLFLLLRLIYRLRKVQKMLNSDDHPEAFSFFRKVRVNQDLPQKEQIEKHEQTHAKQFHTADVLFFEVLSIINWFNPITYLYKKSIRQIHEFIADEQALHLKNNKKDYALLLFSKSFGINPNSLTNNFFNQSLLKRRIMMIQKPKSQKTAIVKYGLSAPLFLIALVLSSATISENKTIKQIENQIQSVQPITEILIPKIVESLVVDEVKEAKVVVPIVSNAARATDFEALKKHIGKTIKYPIQSKQKELMTKIAIEFKINKNGNIESAKGLNQIDNEFSKEAINSLTTFDEKINVEEGNYTCFFTFKLADSKKVLVDETSSLGVIKNYIGEIVVTAYAPSNLAIGEVKVVGNTSTTDDEPIFQNVEVLPGFPGGLIAFQNFLSTNLRYPATARENDIQGRVYCSFVVEMDGGLSNIKVARGIGSGCDEEAVRVISISPKWAPGKQNGNIVRVSYTVPIFFQLHKKAVGVGLIQNNSNSVNNDLKSLSATGKDKPLYIIDGKEITDSKDLNGSLKPDDIKSINVLKDETALKAYGEKGKNGVVIITTKKK